VLVAFFRSTDLRLTLVILVETRHVKAALKSMTVKTRRNDACGVRS
jgi:hypothetical protein